MKIMLIYMLTALYKILSCGKSKTVLYLFQHYIALLLMAVFWPACTKIFACVVAEFMSTEEAGFSVSFLGQAKSNVGDLYKWKQKKRRRNSIHLSYRHYNLLPSSFHKFCKS